MDERVKKMKCGGCGQDAVYGIGLVGAVIYFVGKADSLSTGLIGILKAIVWPAFLVYKALNLIG